MWQSIVSRYEIWVLILISQYCVSGTNQEYSISVDTSEEISRLDHFWRSTGMCPPLPHENASTYFLSRDMLQNLIHIGSVPHSGIEQVRMHWLLDMVGYDFETKSYNFTHLDTLLNTMKNYSLYPGFELMGSPSGKFTNFDDRNQVLEWMALVTTLAKRYITMLGLEHVSQWNFETWNEPDHKDFDNVVMTVEGFLKYYDACSEGLKAAHESLIFGGPGGSCRKKSFSKRCWALFDHCIEGQNYITGKKGSRMDYISMHKKGRGSSSYILESEIETVSQIHSLHPSLNSTPIFNDEGDPMVGWSKPYPWRADATYPAVVAKIIAQHQYAIIANKTSQIKYSLLSNDNGFLSYSPHYFTQRTLNARFQMNNTSPPHVHLVKKPIHALMVLLSKLGNMQLKVSVMHNGAASNDLVGALASICRFQSPNCPIQEIAVLTYASDDTKPTANVFNISIDLNGGELRQGDGSSDTVLMMNCVVNNNKSTNPAKIWTAAGQPDFPSNVLFQNMHDASEPHCYGPIRVDVTSPDLNIQFKLPMPGVSLHHICWMPPSPPGAPILISVTNITSGQVIISWGDSSIGTKCVDSYTIQLCSVPGCGVYKTLNNNRVISNSFVYIAPSNKDSDVYGLYRVAVKDYWNRISPFSNGIVYYYNKGDA